MVSRFERAVLIEATRLRELFASHDQSYLLLEVKVSGPVDHDSLKVTFRVGSDTWGESSVEADTVEAAAAEYFRRKGWKQNHDALKLEYLDSHKEY